MESMIQGNRGSNWIPVIYEASGTYVICWQKCTMRDTGIQLYIIAKYY